MFLLFCRVEEIDSRLGFFQKTFHLSGNEIRTVVTRESRLITRDCDQIKVFLTIKIH